MNPLQYAQMASAAYSAVPTFGARNSAARAIVSDTDDGQVVSFPGTNNLACWLTDLNIDVMPVMGMGNVHEGFWSALCTLRSSLFNLSPQVTVGHSEGAALAILYAAALCCVNNPPKAVFAFEAPRVSIDSTIGDLFMKHDVKVFIYRNGNDVVTDVPNLIHDWQHPAPLIHIGHPTYHFPNVDDHMIQKVIKALTVAN